MIVVDTWQSPFIESDCVNPTTKGLKTASTVITVNPVRTVLTTQLNLLYIIRISNRLKRGRELTLSLRVVVKNKGNPCFD